MKPHFLIPLTNLNSLKQMGNCYNVNKNCHLKRLFNQCVNHKPQNWKSLQKLREITKPIWNKSYPQEPYDPPSKENSKTNFQSSFDYDISEAIQRQKLFFYQVSLPHYHSLEFLNVALERFFSFIL